MSRCKSLENDQQVLGLKSGVFGDKGFLGHGGSDVKARGGRGKGRYQRNDFIPIDGGNKKIVPGLEDISETGFVEEKRAERIVNSTPIGERKPTREDLDKIIDGLHAAHHPGYVESGNPPPISNRSEDDDYYDPDDLSGGSLNGLR